MQRLWAACAPPGWGQPGASPWRQPPGEAFPSLRWPRFLCGPGRAARACCAGWVPALRQTSQEAFWRFSSSRCSFLDNRPATGIRTGDVPGTSRWASLVAQKVKRLPAMRETRVRFLGREDPLEKEMAIHSSTLAWKIPWTEEPDRLQSMGSQRVGHD